MSRASASASSATPQPSPLPQSHHLVTVRVSPQHEEDLIVSTLYLRDSLFIWCGQTDRGRDIEAEIREHQQQQASSSSGTVQVDNSSGATPSSSSADIEAAALASLSEEERRQLEVDRQVDEEIARAMEAAGRTGDDGEANGAATGTPQGYLAREWAMAMHNNSNSTRGGPTGGAATSLFRSAADVAAPMARRLAKRLDVAQVHLSLSLPPDFGAAAGGMGPGMGAAASSSPLLALERGIEEAVVAGRGSIIPPN